MCHRAWRGPRGGRVRIGLIELRSGVCVPRLTFGLSPCLAAGSRASGTSRRCRCGRASCGPTRSPSATSRKRTPSQTTTTSRKCRYETSMPSLPAVRRASPCSGARVRRAARETAFCPRGGAFPLLRDCPFPTILAAAAKLATPVRVKTSQGVPWTLSPPLLVPTTSVGRSLGLACLGLAGSGAWLKAQGCADGAPGPAWRRATSGLSSSA